jgi:magnesium transporter
MSERPVRTRGDKKGLMPGTLVHVGPERDANVHVRVLDYNENTFRDVSIEDIARCAAFTSNDSVSWIDVDGIHNAALVESLGQLFSIHMLVLEDIMNAHSRPKVEFYDNYTFITLKMLEKRASGEMGAEQLSLVIGEKFLLMFQEVPGDNFDSIRERIKSSRGKVRSKDAYYLAYLVLDTVVDNYIHVSEKLAVQIEELEKVVVARPTESVQHRILTLRREIINFKRSIDPLKEAINTVHRELDDGIAKYYRDLYDHIIYESENLATYRELLDNLLQLYHSALSVRTNEVMKVLTVVTTIFVPLTFLVGVYGMNFENMPELGWRYSYPVLLLSMLLIVAGMLIYFRRKRWI